MIPLDTKQSGGKLLPHSDLRGGVFLGESSRNIQRGMKLGTWNVREVGRYKLDVLGVQEVRWDKGGTVREVTYARYVINNNACFLQKGSHFAVPA